METPSYRHCRTQPEVNLQVVEQGTGPTVVLVHGSWDDHSAWSAVARRLGTEFRTLTYDRRGHGASTEPHTQGSIHQDVDDLVALITQLGDTTVHLVGHSYGASVALLVATEHPHLLRSLAVHEPPLFGALRNDPETKPLLDDAKAIMTEVATLIEGNEPAAAARLFVENIALDGQSMDDVLEPSMQEVWARNASTWLDQHRDPQRLAVQTDVLSEAEFPVLVTSGTTSPPTFAPGILDLVQHTPGALHRQIAGAGHFPHLTHPDEYSTQLLTFLRR